MSLATAAHLMPLLAALPFQVVEVKVIDVDLMATWHGPAGPVRVQHRLSGEAGQRLAADFSIDRPGSEPLPVSVWIEARAPGAGAPVGIDLSTAVGRPGRATLVARRHLSIWAGRAGLAEVWADPIRGERLVLAVRPQVRAEPRLAPTGAAPAAAEPLALRFELLGGPPGALERLDSHLVQAVVGSPVRLTLGLRPRPGAPASAEIDVYLLPRAIDGAELECDLIATGRGVATGDGERDGGAFRVERQGIDLRRGATLRVRLGPDGGVAPEPTTRPSSPFDLVVEITPLF